MPSVRGRARTPLRASPVTIFNLAGSGCVVQKWLAELLQAAWRSPVMPEFVSSLPIVAADGTMRKRLHGERVAGSAHIKTGLLADARAIAGYVLDRNGRRHVVVMIVNHPKAHETDAAMDALLEWVYESATNPARAITNRPGASPPRP